MRPASDDPALLQPHERLREIAAILAEGVRRLRRRSGHAEPTGQILAESQQDDLDPSAPSSPHGLVLTRVSKRRADDGYRC
jgi:hypothetical protein